MHLLSLKSLAVSKDVVVIDEIRKPVIEEG